MREKLAGATVRELGAGTGLCGLVASRLGAKHVVCRDLPEGIAVFKCNATANLRTQVEDQGDSDPEYRARCPNRHRLEATAKTTSSWFRVSCEAGASSVTSLWAMVVAQCGSATSNDQCYRGHSSGGHCFYHRLALHTTSLCSIYQPTKSSVGLYHFSPKSCSMCSSRHAAWISCTPPDAGRFASSVCCRYMAILVCAADTRSHCILESSDASRSDLHIVWFETMYSRTLVAACLRSCPPRCSDADASCFLGCPIGS